MVRQRGGRGGSALSSFLRENNISASAIASAHQRRVQDAEAAAETAGHAQSSAVNDQDDEEVEVVDSEQQDVAGPSSTFRGLSAAEARKRKRKELHEIHKIKLTKEFKKARRFEKDSGKDDDEIAREILMSDRKRSKAVLKDFMPGQTDNCEICQKRFTVTPYTRAGPNGGLVCPKCGKNLADEDDGKKKTKNATNGSVGRPKTKGKKRLGGFGVGTKSLVTLCVETIAANISLADSFGDLPPVAVDRIARMLSKRRLMSPETLELFIQCQPENVSIYDASKLEKDHFIRIFQVCPTIKGLKLYNAIQFRDEVMEYLTGRELSLEHLYLAGANLLTESCWRNYLLAKGKDLKSLRVYFTDKQFNVGVIQTISESCSSLERLKICHNQGISNEDLKYVACTPSLQHVSLHLVQDTRTLAYVNIIEHLGKNLQTFSIRMVPYVGDGLLEAIHKNCTQLSKLRITHSEAMTDAGFTELFTGWKNKALRVIDFEKSFPMTNEDIEEGNPGKIGLHSSGFKAMMSHSGHKLKKLNLHGCQYLSSQAFEEVFASDKRYPDLVDMEISFCEAVTDFIVGLIYQSCPKLQKLNVFGCMKVSNPRVPRGKVLIGVPNARGMKTLGTKD
ncbi:RNI-like protein [Rostrohypoxylon terebratum]|nr:RNI-like protein [Rostrohypoxylon terebratum]